MVPKKLNSYMISLPYYVYPRGWEISMLSIVTYATTKAQAVCSFINRWSKESIVMLQGAPEPNSTRTFNGFTIRDVPKAGMEIAYAIFDPDKLLDIPVKDSGMKAYVFTENRGYCWIVCATSKREARKLLIKFYGNFLTVPRIFSGKQITATRKTKKNIEDEEAGILREIAQHTKANQLIDAGLKKCPYCGAEDSFSQGILYGGLDDNCINCDCANSGEAKKGERCFSVILRQNKAVLTRTAFYLLFFINLDKTE